LAAFTLKKEIDSNMNTKYHIIIPYEYFCETFLVCRGDTYSYQTAITLSTFSSIGHTDCTSSSDIFSTRAHMEYQFYHCIDNHTYIQFLCMELV